MANKNAKKYIYCIIAVLVACAAIAAICFTSCEKKEIVGYDPPTPQEWLDELEAEKNRTDEDFMRTYYLDGIWRDQGSGQLYHVYSGHIFEINSVDYEFGDYYLKGTMVAIQNMEKTRAEALRSGEGGAREAGDEYQLHLNMEGFDGGEAVVKIVDADTVKTVLSSGKEIVYNFVEARDGWPEGYR